MAFHSRVIASAAATSVAALLCGAPPAFADAPEAYARHGEVMLNTGVGTPVTLTNLGTVSDARLSPDGFQVLFITVDKSNVACDRTSLWAMRAKTGAAPRKVLVGQDSQDMKRRLCGLSSPRWSLDSSFAYVISDAWVTSGAVHQVDLKTGSERFVVDGNSLSVLAGGTYSGMLLVTRHKYRSAAAQGSYDPQDVVCPDGKIVLTIPGSEKDEGDRSLAPWLAAHHATLF